MTALVESNQIIRGQPACCQHNTEAKDRNNSPPAPRPPSASQKIPHHFPIPLVFITHKTQTRKSTAHTHTTTGSQVRRQSKVMITASLGRQRPLTYAHGNSRGGRHDNGSLVHIGVTRGNFRHCHRVEQEKVWRRKRVVTKRSRSLRDQEKDQAMETKECQVPVKYQPINTKSQLHNGMN